MRSKKKQEMQSLGYIILLQSLFSYMVVYSVLGCWIKIQPIDQVQVKYLEMNILQSI